MVNHKILLLKFKDNFLENAKEYKYLGCLINSNGSLVNSSLDLSKKAKKVLFSIIAYTSDFGPIPVKVACNLFDTLVKKSLKISKRQSESVSRRMTDNTMAKRKGTKEQTTIYKAYI